MPMISQLPTAAKIAASDAVPVSQSGVVRAVSVGNLLAGTQPAILASAGTLLGRRSFGAGGPEAITLGRGLALNDGTLDVGDGIFQSLETVESVSPNGRLIAVEDGRLKAVTADAVCAVYSAGDHIQIDPSGVISAIWPEGTGAGSSPNWPIDVTAMARVTSVGMDDLLPVLHEGSLKAVTYSQFLNGRTVSQLQPAGDAADGDCILVAQGGNVMARQSLAAVWQWISGKLASVRPPIVELMGNTTLDATVHNGCILVCTAAITISPILINLGSGFHCEIINLGPGDVSLAYPMVTASGVGTIPAGTAAIVRSFSCSRGTIVYASGFGGLAGDVVPGAVSNLRHIDVSTNSVSVAWDAPVSGGSVLGYTLLTRQVGTADWTIRGDGISGTDFLIVGLLPGLSYDIAVAASNMIGRGALSSILNVSIPAGQLAPGVVLGLLATPQSSNSVSVSWLAPLSGGQATSYTLQYRVSGSGTWSHSIPSISATALVVNDLTPATGFEFRVYAMNEGGAGLPTEGIVATTFPQAGAVALIVWNLVPVGSYSSGVGSIGVNARVQPADASVRFGFSTSSLVAPITWTVGTHVNTDFWAAYVPTPSTFGTWYAWVQGLDGSASVAHPTSFTVV